MLSTSGGGGAVDSVTGTLPIVANPTTGNVGVSINASTYTTLGAASFDITQFIVTSGAVSLLNPPDPVWVINNTSGALGTNSGSFVTSGSPVFTLPAGTTNDFVGVALSGGTSWTIDITGRSVIWGAITGTTDIHSNLPGDVIIMRCVTANLWQVLDSIGNADIS